MSDIGGPRKVLPGSEPIPEAVRVARGWLEPLKLVQRLERRAAGRPVLELMRNEPGLSATRRQWASRPSWP